MPNTRAIIGENRLLQLLPHQDVDHVLSQCDLVELSVGQVLINANETITYAYFPLSGIISWEKQIIGCPYLLLSLVGYEGMLSIELTLNVNHASCRAVVQKAGFAWRLPVKKLEYFMLNSPALLEVLKNYTFVVISQLIQNNVCNHFHLLECRLARTFLMLQFRAKSSEFTITHESLALMLGVRRVGITKAANALQNLNIIRYSRGHVSVLNQPKLLLRSCVCYKSDIEIYEKYLAK